MYQTEHQTLTTMTKGTEVLCHRLTESTACIHAVTRLSTMLGIPADTVADLIAPLGITTNKGADIPGLDTLLHTAKVLGFIEEYTITKEPRCHGDIKHLTIEGPMGADGLSFRIALPSGWLVELDLPGAMQACVHELSHNLHTEPWNKPGGRTWGSHGWQRFPIRDHFRRD